MKKLICLLALVPQLVFAQDYISYQHTFNRIDEDVQANDLATANKRLDSIYNNYRFIRANHCIKALQICCVANDSVNANKWLAKAYTQGVPHHVILVNDLTSRVLHYSTTQQTLKAYDSLRAVYSASYNHELAQLIDSLMVIDQKRTKKVNYGFILWRYIIYYPRWLHNNKKEYAIINRIIDQYGYPGERLIGLTNEYMDTAWVRKSFRKFGPRIMESRVQIMFMHYYSNSRTDINDKLRANIVTGHLTPREYGIFNDFLAATHRGKKRGNKHYRSWSVNDTSEELADVNARRNAIGLNSFEQQKENTTIFNKRLDDKTAASTVILEL